MNCRGSTESRLPISPESHSGMRNFSYIKQNRCVRGKSKLSFGCINIWNCTVVSETIYCVKQWIRNLDHTLSLQTQYKNQRLDIWKILIINADGKQQHIHISSTIKKKKSGRLSANWTNPEPEMKYPEFLAKGHLEDVNQIHLAVEVIRRSATSL